MIIIIVTPFQVHQKQYLTGEEVHENGEEPPRSQLVSLFSEDLVLFHVLHEPQEVQREQQQSTETKKMEQFC